MLKRIFLLILIISFLSISSCFAFDKDSIKNIWTECVIKITEWWNLSFVWINNDMKPWIEKNLGPEVKQEFEKEFNEAIKEIPITINAIWNKAKELF